MKSGLINPLLTQEPAVDFASCPSPRWITIVPPLINTVLGGGVRDFCISLFGNHGRSSSLSACLSSISFPDGWDSTCLKDVQITPCRSMECRCGRNPGIPGLSPTLMSMDSTPSADVEAVFYPRQLPRECFVHQFLLV
jgi:hypothetical protein